MDTGQLVKLFNRLLPSVTGTLFPRLPRTRRLHVVSNYYRTRRRTLLHGYTPLCPSLRRALGVLSDHFPLFVIDGYRTKCVRIFLGSANFKRCFGNRLYPNSANVTGTRGVVGVHRSGGLSSPICVNSAVKSFGTYQGTKIPFVFTRCNFNRISGPSCQVAEPFSLARVYE